jgi:hypothetical protein
VTEVPQLDPIKFGKWGWPGVSFYKQQRDILYSIWDNDETVVVAGNTLGKDFVAGFAALAFFLTRDPCKVITTSAKDDHLRVLWGEINWFIDNCRYPLDAKSGGPLQINHQELRKVVNGQRMSNSYCMGMVASQDSIAAMGGHYARPKTPDNIPHELWLADEASSVADGYYPIVSPWAARKYIFGNAWECSNFFKRLVDAGDLPRDGRPGYYRKVIRVRVEDSPNIRFARAEIESGRRPSGRIVTPGVKDWDTYQRELKTFDAIQKSVSHNAEWYEGGELFLFPVEWLDRANDLACNEALRRAQRKARAIGIDPGEGGANTSMCAVDEFGVVALASWKTPDTSQIGPAVIEFGKRLGVSPEHWLFDRGGGGKQHADRLRKDGYNVRTVSFGEGIELDVKPTGVKVKFTERKGVKEEKSAYKDRRAQMFYEAAELLDPGINPVGFGVPSHREGQQYGELRRQLKSIPKRYDDHGVLYLIPKHAKPGHDGKVNPNTETLVKILGCSPDEADAFVLAVHGMLHPLRRTVAGGAEFMQTATAR